MNERERLISEAFTRFAKVRRQKPDDMAAEVIGIALSAAGQASLSPEDRRYLAACIDCGWWTPYTPKGETVTVVNDAFDRMPDASAATPVANASTVVAVPADGVRGRATIWD